MTTEWPSVLLMVTRREQPWRPADFLPLATDITGIASRATTERQAGCSTPERDVLVERLRARVVAQERQLRDLSDELQRMRREKAVLEQEAAAAARRGRTPSDGRWASPHGERAL